MLFCTYIYEGQECVGIIDDNKQKVFDMKELFVVRYSSTKGYDRANSYEE